MYVTNEIKKGKSVEALLASNTLDFLVRYKLNLATRLSEYGFKVYLGAPNAAKNNQNKVKIKNNIELIKFGEDRKGLSAIYNIYRSLLRFKLKNPNAIIITHTVYLNIIAILILLFSPRNKNKFFIFVSGFGPSLIRKSLKYKLLGNLYISSLRKISDNPKATVVTLNIEDKNLIQDFIPSRKVLLYREGGLTKEELKLNEKNFKDIESRTINVGYLGRFLSEKGVIDIINVVEISKQLGLNFNFFLGGNEDLQNKSSYKLNNINAVLNKNASIEINPSYASFFKKIDILLFPSYREGHPLYLFRSMAYGVIPITYPNPGNTVDVIHDFNGIITPSSTVTGLLSGLIKLNNNRKRLVEISKNAQNYSKNFSQDKCDDNFIKLIINQLSI
tara:strand:- start:556 stop:1722 length:1167 start_codon:yes stop_codon:yes gene_type:complete